MSLTINIVRYLDEEKLSFIENQAWEKYSKNLGNELIEVNVGTHGSKREIKISAGELYGLCQQERARRAGTSYKKSRVTFSEPRPTFPGDC